MPETIRFYKSKDPYGFMSNLYPAPLTIWNRRFLTSEHAYQFRKPVEPIIAEWIAAAPDGEFAAVAGHGLRKKHIRPDWESVKISIMEQVVMAKFRQNPHLREQLLRTDDSVLVEASPTDKFWGEGADGAGRNVLGMILVGVRAILRGDGPLCGHGLTWKAIGPSSSSHRYESPLGYTDWDVCGAPPEVPPDDA